jgi:hypothetical protein
VDESPCTLDLSLSAPLLPAPCTPTATCPRSDNCSSWACTIGSSYTSSQSFRHDSRRSGPSCMRKTMGTMFLNCQSSFRYRRGSRISRLRSLVCVSVGDSICCRSSCSFCTSHRPRFCS